MTVAHRWPLVFDRTTPVGHTLRPGHRVRWYWQSARTACGVSVSDQVLGRKFDPDHERACPKCAARVRAEDA